MPDTTNNDPWAGAAPSKGGDVGPMVLVWDVGGNRPASVPAGQVEQGIKEGRFRTTSASNVTTNAQGTPITRSVQEGTGAVAAGESQLSGAREAQEASRQSQRDAFNTLSDGIDTFFDGLKSTLTVGLAHDRGEKTEIRNSQHGIAHFAGATLGFLSTLPIPGASEENAARLALGKALANTPLGLVERAVGAGSEAVFGTSSGIAAKAARGALNNAGVSLALSTGQAVGDAIIENKNFAGEHIINNIPIDALVGGLFDGAGALFQRSVAKTTGRRAIEAQDGLLNPESEASAEAIGHVNKAIDGYHEALATNQSKMAVYEKLAADGQLPEIGDFMGPRRKAMAEAEAAKKALDKHDLVGALNGGDAKELEAALDAHAHYRQKVMEFDEAMPLSDAEKAHLPSEASNVAPGPVLQRTPTHLQEGFSPASFDLDARMEASPELLAKYKELHGRDYEPMGTGDTVPDLQNLGGVETPTSANETGAGKRRQVAPSEPTNPGLGMPNREPGTLAEGPNAAPTMVNPARPEPPPAIIEKIDGGRKARLEDGSTVWRSEHRKATQDYLRQLDSYQKELDRTIPGMPEGMQRGPNGTLATAKETPAQLAPRGEVNVDLAGPVNGPQKTINLSKRDTAYDIAAVALAKADAEEQKVIAAKMAHDAKAEAVAAKEAERARLKADAAMDKATTLHASEKTDRTHYNSRAARDYLQQIGNQSGPRMTPGDIAAAKLQSALDGLAQVSAGKLDAASALEIAGRMGIKDKARDVLSDRLIQLWGVRQIARQAGQASKNGFGKYLVNKAVAMGAGSVGASAIGPLGYIVGHAVGMSANLAGSAGRFRETVVAAANALLKGKRSQLVARVISHTAAYSYDGSEPTTDLKARVSQLQSAVSDPEATRERVIRSLGTTAIQHPDVADAAANTVLNRLQYLSVSAPLFVWLGGKQLEPTTQAVRHFRIKEDATWNPDILVTAVRNGTMTTLLADVLHSAHPELSNVLNQELLRDPDALVSLPREKLRQIEIVTGMPLTSHSDPAYGARQQMRFEPLPEDKNPVPGNGSGGSLKGPPPTPSQAQSRAPGN